MLTDFWTNKKLRCNGSSQTRQAGVSHEGRPRSPSDRTGTRITKRQWSFVVFVGRVLTSMGAAVLSGAVVHWLGSPSIFVVVLWSAFGTSPTLIFDAHEYLHNQAKQQQLETRLARMQEQIDANKERCERCEQRADRR